MTAFGRFSPRRTLAIGLGATCVALLGSCSAAFARPIGVERGATPAAQARVARAVPGIGAARGGQAATRARVTTRECRPRNGGDDGRSLILADLLGCVDCRFGVGAWRCSVGHALGICVRAAGREGRFDHPLRSAVVHERRAAAVLPAASRSRAPARCIPLVDWGSWDNHGAKYQPAFSLGRIIDGSFDWYIRRWATGARDWGHPFFLRFDHEMNGDWFTWSEGVNGNTAGQFVAAWRHVHDVFESVGASNVTWVWSPIIRVLRAHAAGGDVSRWCVCRLDGDGRLQLRHQSGQR